MSEHPTRLPAASWMMMVLTLALALPVEAAQPLDRLLACRQIASSPARLACFDRESAAIAAVTAADANHGARAARAADAAHATDRSAPASGGSTLDPQQTFGLPPEQILAREEAVQRAPRPLDHIDAHIVALASTGDGREIFTLDNHQVWKELEPDGDLYAKPGETVKISRGWLGSYSLSLKSRRSAKVTRLR